MSERYAFIRAEKACTGFPVRRGCLLLEVSPSGYYAWRERPASQTAARRAEIAELAAEAHHDGRARDRGSLRAGRLCPDDVLVADLDERGLVDKGGQPRYLLNHRRARDAPDGGGSSSASW